RWHVVLVVFGQNLFSNKNALFVDSAQRHNSLPFSEQVRQDTGVADRNAGLVVGNLEQHFQGLLVPFHAAIHHHATGTNTLSFRSFSCGNLGRVIEQVDILTQSKERETDGNGYAGNNKQNDVEPLFAMRFHKPASSRRRRWACSCSNWRRRIPGSTKLNTRASRVTP